MAAAATVKLLILLTSFIISVPTAASANPSSLSSPAPQMPQTYPPSFFATILSTLGFQELSTTVTANANLSLITPITIFAPTDSSLLTCPSCSLLLLLQEHSIAGLYTLHFLRTLAFGTKIESVAPNRCLTVTSSSVTPNTPISTKKVFVNGVEITKPDLFNNGLVIVHGLQGFITHLSSLSCSVESMTSLSFPPRPLPVAEFLFIRLMLKEAMMHLRVNGYSLLALAMRMNYAELSGLKSMTLFAIDDASIFTGREGHEYVSHLMFHIVPNRLLMGSDLMGLPPQTALSTMERGQKLVVTTAGGGGPFSPTRINYVKVKNFDIVYNQRIVVHGLSTPFLHVHDPTAEDSLSQNEGSRSRHPEITKGSDTPATAPAIASTVGIQNHVGF